MKDLILVNGTYQGMGGLSQDDYSKVANGLRENELIKEIPDLNKFYRNCIFDDKK